MSENEDLIFVELAIKRELLTQEQVDELLEMKAKLEAMGLSESIAELAAKKGMLSEKDANLLRMKVSSRGGGHQIEGYRLVSRLGRGGMGSVYKAVQISMDRSVALKVLKPSLVKDDQQVARLRREAQLIGRLEHPNIVRGLDFGVSNGFHYFAMEYVDGESVKGVLDEKGPFKEADALEVVRKVALALDHAHAEGIVHRDIKPGNILLSRDGAVKLADYGLAKGPLEDQSLTQSGVTVGTPQYISPEQAKGPSEVDIRTDLYSLGATLYHMVTGRPPFEGETLAHLIQQVLYEPYAPPRTLRRDLSPDVAFLIDKLMARRPRHRFQTPKELLAALATLANGKSIVPADWHGDFEVFHQKRRLRKLTVATILILVIGAVSAIYVSISLNAERQRVFNDRARAALKDEQEKPLTRDNVTARIAEAKKIKRDYGGSTAGQRIQQYLDGLLAEHGYLMDQNHLRGRVSERAEEEQWAAALRAVETSRTTMPKENSTLAAREVEEFFLEVKAQRDDWVAEEFGRELDRLLTADPKDARDVLKDLLEAISDRSFLEEEGRTPLEEPGKLVARLDQAIKEIDRYLERPGSLLTAAQETNYREVRESLAKALKSFNENTELKKTLASLPEPWALRLTKSLEDFDDLILTRNRSEMEDLKSDSIPLLTTGSYEDVLEQYAELSARSVEEISNQLARDQRLLTDQKEEIEAAMANAWTAFFPEFTDYLTRREWMLAGMLLDRLRPQMAGINPNPYWLHIEGAARVLDASRTLEEELLHQLDGMSSVPGGLDFGTLAYQEVYDVRVEGRTLRFRVTPGGRLEAMPVSSLAVADILRLTGRDHGDALSTLLQGLFEWGEIRKRNPRQVKDALPATIDRVLRGLEMPDIVAIIDQLAVLMRAEQEAAGKTIAKWEAEALLLYSKAESNFDRRLYQLAFEGFEQLLNSKTLGDTDFVRERKDDIRRYRDRAKEKLPSVRMSRFLGAPVEHLSGERVDSQNYVATVFHDMEVPREIQRFTFDPGRISIVTVESPPIGPPAPWEAPEGDRTVIEHHLRFHSPKVPEDSLDRHPLRYESPFLYQRAMSIEFRVRWTNPTAMVLSLCATNVVVLSDTSRIENGRGVHIWQGTDLSDPSTKVPDELRTTWLKRNPDALKGESVHHRYFQFEASRWYRVRFMKGEKLAELYVDDRLILQKEIEKYAARGREIIFLTYSPCELDELRITGTVDPGWYHSITRREKEEAGK
jgi:eukaryotic-like serine/threonine-protein kinase